MIAILLVFGTIGFACFPPADVEFTDQAYTGPWSMPIKDAAKMAHEARSRGLIVQVVTLEELGFAAAINDCPPIEVFWGTPQ